MLCAVVLELSFRLPVVTKRTGGGTPGRLKWDREHLDPLGLANVGGSFRTLRGEKAKPRGYFRILVLGDSMSWGDKVARTQDTWPHVMQQELKSAGRDVNVINLARRGFTTVSEAKLLETQGWSYQPDAIVLQYFLNDPLPTLPGLGPGDAPWHHRPWWPGHRWLDRHSYFYSWAYWKMVMHRTAALYPRGFAHLHEETYAPWRQTKLALQRIGESARQRGVPAAMMIFPSFQVEGFDAVRYPYMRVHEKVVAAATRAGMPVLDLRPVYEQQGKAGRAWRELPNDGHPNAAAHALAAKAVAQWLIDLSWFKP